MTVGPAIPATSANLARQVREQQCSWSFKLLIDRYQRSLHHVVREFEWACMYDVEHDDLQQAALIGYWEACDTFDPGWDVMFGTYASTFAKRRMGHLVRAARTRKHLMLTTAGPLEQPASADGEERVMDTVAAPEYWQPEVMAEIRADLQALSSELPGSLSSVEYEALGRVMLDEHVGQSSGIGRVRAKASHILRYGWAPQDRRHAAQQRRARGLELVRDGLTYREIAERLGVDKSRVTQWVRDDRQAA